MTLLHRLLLQEGLGPLYHATHARAAVAILRENLLELGYSRGDAESEISRDYPFFASFSRTLRNRFRSHTNATLVVDGDALRARYRLQPVDYWRAGPEGSESEERLFSKEPEIPNFKRFLLSTHFLYDARQHQLGIYDSLEYFDNCWFYANRADYLMQRRGELAETFLPKQTMADEPVYTTTDRSSRPLQDFQNLLAWLERGGRGQSKDKGEYRWYQYLWSMPHDFITQFANEVGNLKAHPGVAARGFRRRLEALLAKYGAKTLREFALKFYEEHSPHGEKQRALKRSRK